MSNGGTVSIKNPNSKSFAVTITAASGSPTFLKSGGGTASFPETITGDETFATTTDCAITVSVKYLGTEVAASPDGTVSTELKNGCYLIIQPSPDSGYDFAGPVSTTTAALEAVGNAINTTGKYAGKMVWNATTGLPLWADGGAAADTWSISDGTATHTPV